MLVVVMGFEEQMWLYRQVYGCDNYLIKTNHAFFQLMKINCTPPPNLLLADFPIAKACLLFVQRQDSPNYYFFHSQHINGYLHRRKQQLNKILDVTYVAQHQRFNTKELSCSFSTYKRLTAQTQITIKTGCNFCAQHQQSGTKEQQQHNSMQKIFYQYRLQQHAILDSNITAT